MNTSDFITSTFPIEAFSFSSQHHQDQIKIIQKNFRGFRIRKGFLPRHLYPVYKSACEELNESTPRAEEGKTVVFLPISAPEIVIKQTGKEKAKERFFKMNAIRSVLQAEGFKNLIIPKAQIYKESLIEERLSVCTDQGYNAALYLSNKDLFNDPIRQITKLFAKAYIDYLVEKNPEDNSVIRIRYDNIPFILNNQDGKKSIDFALIDLERSSVGIGIKKTVHKLYILTSMFPFHTSLIEVEAMKSGMMIGEQEKRVMENAAIHSKLYLEKKSEEYNDKLVLP